MTRSVNVSQPLPAWEAGEPGADREDAVEEEHAALGPGREIAARGHRQAEIGAELGEDVAERRAAASRLPGPRSERPIAWPRPW